MDNSKARRARKGEMRTLVQAVLLASAGLSGVFAASTPAAAQSARSYDVAAGSLADALNDFAEQSGVELVYDSALVAGRTSGGIKGRHNPAAALSRLLAGSGLTARRTSANTFTVERALQAEAGVVQLGTLRVEGASGSAGGGNGDGASGGNGRVAGWDGTAGTVYSTPGSVSVITRETLEAYPGQSPADMLRGATGVISGEARTSGGLDVNIRGLQGQGRVPVTVDGAINGTTVYRGYQGTSNRSFVDPDFISHVAIEKGPSMGNPIAGGIGGSVSMTTLSADDIVPEGETVGLRIKASLSNNSTEPGSNMTRSLLAPSSYNGDTLAATRERNRPGFFSPTGGAGSLVFARKGDFVDLVAGYSFRRTGNYHAGANGKHAPEATGTPSAFCAAGAASGSLASLCERAVQFYDRYGSTPFVGGEEVLNTSTDAESVLLKATLRPAADHVLELGYGGYWSDFGENYPGSTGSASGTVLQTYPLSHTGLDRVTARYRWNPATDLVDLKLNGWISNLRESAASLLQTDQTRRFVNGLGVDIGNGSRVLTPLGLLSADYGASFLRERTGPVDGWNNNGSLAPGREGTRRETSVFGQAALEPMTWLRLDAGLRYQKYKLQDEQSGTTYHTDIFDRSEDAVSFSLGATLMPVDGLQLFASYKQAARLPSLMEATTGFFMIANPDLHKEEAHNWEAGMNYSRKGVLADGDELGVKLAWFDNDIDGYIARRYISAFFAMQMFNIDRAQFRGVEGSLSYRTGGLSVDAGATYYDHIAFCKDAATGCVESSLASDYATNYIPPRWSANLAVSQKFLAERAMLGGRLTYTGKRAVGAQVPQSGYMPLISAIAWNPYVLLDLTGQFKVTDALSLDWSLDNVTDRYYTEAMSLGYIPAPGRTFRIGLTGKLGSKTALWPANWFSGWANEDAADWTGPYIGADFGYGLGKTGGSVTDSMGQAADIENGSRIDQKMRNVLGGLHAGYNYQLPGNLVLGVEADISAGNLGSWSGVLVSEESTATQWLRNNHQLESDTRYNWDRMITLRGKLGYSLGRTLIYGTGGIGWLRETQTRNQYRSVDAQNRGIGSALEHLFAEEDRKNRQGFVLGGGVERAIGDHWSVRAEYSYARFERKTFSFAKAREGVSIAYSDFDVTWHDDGTVSWEYVNGPGSSNIANGRKVRSDADLHHIRLGVSYRF
ncbi:TonB-dependent receptor domain-containing protein [Novosphingobium sp. RL4]|uniref:TonB-dependent receptor domain-containing protein n=1 Tax=Novosphingobium sp. RL4 TaxID=3109595 RepID=UPI002D77032F|nr:TonB-dependent receptor [Novosphingobium sp. RL4]WRT95828.1 TonB-dependent receptor [Novosphingobium sp. RL4]